MSPGGAGNCVAGVFVCRLIASPPRRGQRQKSEKSSNAMDRPQIERRGAYGEATKDLSAAAVQSKLAGYDCPPITGRVAELATR
jgi:hypothetical protein